MEDGGGRRDAEHKYCLEVESEKKGRQGRREQLARDKKHGRKGKTTSYYSN